MTTKYLVWKEHNEFDRMERRSYDTSEILEMYKSETWNSPILLGEFETLDAAREMFAAEKTVCTTSCGKNSLNPNYINLYADVIYIEEINEYAEDCYDTVCNWDEYAEPLVIEES